MSKNLVLNAFLGTLLVSATACSPSSYLSTESFAGTALGAAAGSGVGLLFANKHGNTAENVLINGAIGSGVGLLAGAMLHERNLEVAKEREVVLREARLLHENEREITELRRRIEAASSWGNNEATAFDQRYPEKSYERPYQGPQGLLP